MSDTPTLDALIELLKTKGTEPISMYDIGIPLIGAGHSQDQIVNALFYLESQRNIKLIDGNRLQVLDLSLNRRHP